MYFLTQTTADTDYLRGSKTSLICQVTCMFNNGNKIRAYTHGRIVHREERTKMHVEQCTVEPPRMIVSHLVTDTFLFLQYAAIYSRLSLSRIPRDSLKYFEISVPRHIRFAELRKKIIRTTTFDKYMCNEVRDILKILWKRGEIAP